MLRLCFCVSVRLDETRMWVLALYVCTILMMICLPPPHIPLPTGHRPPQQPTQHTATVLGHTAPRTSTQKEGGSGRETNPRRAEVPRRRGCGPATETAYGYGLDVHPFRLSESEGSSGRPRTVLLLVISPISLYCYC